MSDLLRLPGRQAAYLDQLEAERLDTGEETLELRLVADRPSHDRLGRLDGGREVLEGTAQVVAEPALDPYLVAHVGHRAKIRAREGEATSPPGGDVKGLGLLRRLPSRLREGREQRLHYKGVELGAGAAAQLGRGLLVGQGGLYGRALVIAS